jgi:myosin protein heavy chain
LQLELDSALSGKNSIIEEKRRLEERVSQLEDELEDEQSTGEQTIDKLKKQQFDIEKLTTDLHIEKSNLSKSESAKLMLEKQIRELRDKVTEHEEVSKGRSKAAISNLEAKLASFEEQLHLESNEKHRITREFKKSEKRLREMQSQIEEERKLAENYKEQLEKMQAKLKANKRIIDENEEEVTQLKNKNRKIARDIDELNEQNEILTREISLLKQKHSKITTSTLLSSTKIRSNTSSMIKSIMSETSQDLDDDEYDTTLNNTNMTHNGNNGNGGTHSSTNFGSLSTLHGSNGNGIVKNEPFS